MMIDHSSVLFDDLGRLGDPASVYRDTSAPRSYRVYMASCAALAAIGCQNMLCVRVLFAMKHALFCVRTQQ
jgi:hypothetical protein